MQGCRYWVAFSPADVGPARPERKRFRFISCSACYAGRPHARVKGGRESAVRIRDYGWLVTIVSKEGGGIFRRKIKAPAEAAARAGGGGHSEDQAKHSRWAGSRHAAGRGVEGSRVVILVVVIIAAAAQAIQHAGRLSPVNPHDIYERKLHELQARSARLRRSVPSTRHDDQNKEQERPLFSQ